MGNWSLLLTAHWPEQGCLESALESFPLPPLHEAFASKEAWQVVSLAVGGHGGFGYELWGHWACSSVSSPPAPCADAEWGLLAVQL